METLTKQRTFIAHCHNQVLVIEQARDVRDDVNKKIGVIPSKQIEFADSQFIVTDESAAKVGMTFDELVRWLHDHEQFEAVERGIWDEGAPPDELLPTIKEVSTAIFAAVARQEPDELMAIKERERATHNRLAVLQTADAGLEQLAEADAG